MAELIGQFIFFVLVCGFFGFIVGWCSPKCPKCDGKMKNIGTHKDKIDGTVIYKCLECKEKWI